MRAPKPQMWTRESAGGLVMRNETDSDGRWRVTRGGGTDRLGFADAPVGGHADARRHTLWRAGGPWRRMCRRCEAPMAFDPRNRPDSGPQFPQHSLWVCSSRACIHAEPADD
jgi:hypothetical protein